MTTSTGTGVTYTGDNLDAITDLGVHVVAHPTQPALVVFDHDAALDPIGILAVGQNLLIDADGARIGGAPSAEVLDLPAEDVFDPSKATIAEVVEYLSGLDETPEGEAEAARVIEAEKAGQNRKTLVGDGE